MLTRDELEPKSTEELQRLHDSIRAELQERESRDFPFGAAPSEWRDYSTDDLRAYASLINDVVGSHNSLPGLETSASYPVRPTDQVVEADGGAGPAAPPAAAPGVTDSSAGDFDLRTMGDPLPPPPPVAGGAGDPATSGNLDEIITSIEEDLGKEPGSVNLDEIIATIEEDLARPEDDDTEDDDAEEEEEGAGQAAIPPEMLERMPDDPFALHPPSRLSEPGSIHIPPLLGPVLGGPPDSQVGDPPLIRLPTPGSPAAGPAPATEAALVIDEPMSPGAPPATSPARTSIAGSVPSLEAALVIDEPASLGAPPVTSPVGAPAVGGGSSAVSDVIGPTPETPLEVGPAVDVGAAIDVGAAAAGEVPRTDAEIKQITELRASWRYYRDWYDKEQVAYEGADDTNATDSHYSDRQNAANQLRYIENNLTAIEDQLAALDADIPDDFSDSLIVEEDGAVWWSPKGWGCVVQAAAALGVTLVIAGALIAYFVLGSGNGRRIPVTTSPTTQIPISPISEARAAAAYLSAVAPVNVAESAFYALADMWTSSTTDATARAAAVPLVSALDTVHGRLISIATHYPVGSTQLRRDARAVVAVNDDLSELANLDTIGVTTWTSRFDTSLTALTAASNSVRSALGLPPTATASPAPPTSTAPATSPTGSTASPTPSPAPAPAPAPTGPSPANVTMTQVSSTYSGGACVPGTWSETLQISGAAPGSSVELVFTGAGLPPSQTFAISSAGTISFSMTAGSTAPSGEYLAELYAVNGTPVPPQDMTGVGGNNCAS